jgi:hypothetical protein
MLGDLTKPVTVRNDTEVGTTGFWPSQGEIFPLAIETPVEQMLAYFAGHYPTIRHTSN